MKVLLISTYSVFPIGLRYLAAFLEQHGHSVSLQRLNDTRKNRILRIVEKVQPDVVGFTCYTKDALKVLKAAYFVRQGFPGVKIVLGNVHATIFYEKILKDFPFVDYIVLGEAENALKDLLEHVAGRKAITDVPNVAYREEDGQVVKTREERRPLELDDLSDLPKGPIPKELVVSHYHKFSYLFRAYFLKYQDKAEVCSSRGCPYGCDYCAENCISRGKWRAQSPETVVNGIEKMMKAYTISHFNFVDPLFTLDKQRVKLICQEIIRRGLRITWSFQTHPHHIDEDLVPLLKQAGCVHFAIGIDCSSDLEMYKHRRIHVDYDDLARVVKSSRALKMTVKINLIVGWPGESFRDALEAARHIKKLSPTHISIYSLLLMPGSRLFDEAVGKGYIDRHYWLNRKSPSVYRATCAAGKPAIGMVMRLACRRMIISLAALYYCKSLNGILFFIFYTLESLLDLCTEEIRKLQNIFVIKNLPWSSLRQ